MYGYVSPAIGLVDDRVWPVVSDAVSHRSHRCEIALIVLYQVVYYQRFSVGVFSDTLISTGCLSHRANLASPFSKLTYMCSVVPV